MKTEKIIDTAYATLQTLADRDINAAQWLNRAYITALQQEREHRWMGRSFGGGYRWPSSRTAKWFVLKWVLNPPACPPSWSDFAGYREDVQWSAAVSAQIGRDRIVAAIGLDNADTILEIDYSKEIAKS